MGHLSARPEGAPRSGARRPVQLRGRVDAPKESNFNGSSMPLGDRWAFGPRRSHGVRGHRTPVLAAAVSLFMVLGMTGAFADQIVADADALILDSPHGNSQTATQAVGTTRAYDFSAAIRELATADNVFPGAVSVSIAKSGTGRARRTAGPWIFTGTNRVRLGPSTSPFRPMRVTSRRRCP